MKPYQHYYNLTYKCFIVSMLSLFLCACGFHLRRDVCDLNALYPTIVCPLSGSHSLHQALYLALQTNKVTVLDAPIPNEKLPKICIISQAVSAQPLVYGADGEERRERLRMTVTFGVNTDKPETITLATYRDRQLNNRQHLGDNSEKALLEREMQQDIIQQLFRYLVSKNSVETCE